MREDQAENLRKKMENISEQQEDELQLPPRSEVHKKKKRNGKLNIHSFAFLRSFSFYCRFPFTAYIT